MTTNDGIRCVVINPDPNKSFKVDWLDANLDRQIKSIVAECRGNWEAISFGHHETAMGFVNDLGQLNGMAINSLATALLRPYAAYTLRGPAVIIGRNLDETCSIGDPWLAKIREMAGRLGWTEDEPATVYPKT